MQSDGGAGGGQFVFAANSMDCGVDSEQLGQQKNQAPGISVWQDSRPRRPEFQQESVIAGGDTLVNTEYGVGAITGFDPLSKLFAIRLSWGAEMRIHQDKVTILPHRCPGVTGMVLPPEQAHDVRGRKRRDPTEEVPSSSLPMMCGASQLLSQGPLTKRTSNDSFYPGQLNSADTSMDMG